MFDAPMSARAAPPPPWWRSLLTGQDNQSLAIGRVLGALLFSHLLVCLPATIVLALWLRRVEPSVWFALLAALAVYVPAIVVAVGGLIAGTAFTEPPAARAARAVVGEGPP